MLNATVVLRRDLVKNELIILGVKPDAPIPDFIPGQYVTLGLPPESPRLADSSTETSPPQLFRSGCIERAYSIGSSPEQKDFVEFYLAIVQDGTLTPRLGLLHVGDRVYIGHKYVGTFTLKEIPQDKDLIMIATGTGLAPFMSMVRTKSTWTPGRQITLIHGVRYAADFSYAEELEALQKLKPEFRYLPIASREPEGTQWVGARGRLQKFIDSGELKLDPARQHILMCGNPAMIEENQKKFTSVGFIEHSKRTPGNLHLEKYW